MASNFRPQSGRVSHPTPRDNVSTGVIDPNAMYRADEAKARAGWGKDAFASARRKGLPVHRCGKRVYVVGADLIAFITSEKGGQA